MGFCTVWASAASTTSRGVLVRSAAQSRKLDRNPCGTAAMPSSLIDFDSVMLESGFPRGLQNTRPVGSDAPICQDGRSGGFTELLARAEVSHDALIDFPSEKAFKASDDVAFRPSIRPASDDIVDRRLVIAHTDHDGSMEGGVRLSVAAPIEAVSTGGHPGGGGDGTRAAELGKGGFRANRSGLSSKIINIAAAGVGANGEALPEGGRRLGGESGEV